LSPGTRGIVLLLLYLALDRDDDRPLIIDQPEENLDPKSIFDELVDCFRRAKLRRQIVIVTHNANLVVNTDADQVIIAKCGPHRPRALPEISYLRVGWRTQMSVARFAKSLKEGRRPSGNVQGGFEYGCRVETVCSWIAWRSLGAIGRVAFTS
jgi:energy-coupling factor transporter ATP-binding protein EcfA2